MIGGARLSGVALQRLRQGDDRIVIIGAGGWVGLATLEALADALGPSFDRRVRCFGSTARILRLRGGIEIAQRSLDELAALPPAPTALLHLAFLTKEKVGSQSDVEYADTNRRLSQAVLDVLGPIGVHGVFVASSGAAYYADSPDASPAMRLYGALKREQEEMFGAWAGEAGRSAVIARIFNLSGPYINKHEHYALASFINDALAGRTIVIKARRKVFRSYVAIAELMSIALGSLLGDEPRVVSFDTAGTRPYEMSEIAEIVVNAVGSGAGIERGPIDEAGEDRYLGSRLCYELELAKQCVVPASFEAQVADTATYIAKSGVP